MKPGTKPLPRNCRRVDRVILNLYPATYDSLSAIAFDFGMSPKDMAEFALVRGLAAISDEKAADDFIRELLINNPLNH